MQQNATKIRNTLQNQYDSFTLIENSIINYVNFNSIDDTIDFSVLIGTMKSPIKDAIIISSFGVHSHQYLKNVTIKNDGIDLYSQIDTIAKCVYKGQIVTIVSIYKSGKSVIVKHGDFFTVYSNLNNIYVTKNQIVYENQPIGSLSVKTSKYSFPCLNFQIWKNNEKLNPNIYLNL
jgi:murein DD-endopeptidase MepM/ murein hydrolase activator NlpD